MISEIFRETFPEFPSREAPTGLSLDENNTRR